MIAPALGRREVDALQELASIGCGRALSALGKLMQRRVEMDVPEVWLGRSEGAIADFVGGLGDAVVAVAVRLEGLLTGHLVLALTERDAGRLASCLGYPAGGDGWSEMSQSALMESGNIVGSAFVSALAQMVGKTLMLSVPRLARGGGRECLDALVDPKSGSVALATRFVCREAPGPLEGLVLVMPDPQQVTALLAAMGGV